jgi:hemerythrin-like metal-binding protein
MYSINVPFIDGQHRRLLEIVNDFYDALRARHGRNVVFEILNRLIHYAEKHFKDEEELMKRAGYPAAEAEQHINMHVGLVEDVFKLHKQLSEQANPDLASVDLFLNSWLINHILTVDKKLLPFCGSMGHFQPSRASSY